MSPIVALLMWLSARFQGLSGRAYHTALRVDRWRARRAAWKTDQCTTEVGD